MDYQPIKSGYQSINQIFTHICQYYSILIKNLIYKHLSHKLDFSISFDINQY